MRPRGLAAHWIMTSLWTGPMWGCGTAGFFAVMTGERFTRVIPTFAVGGALFGLMMGAFTALRTRAVSETLTLDENLDAFLSRLTLRLAELDFYPETTVGSAYTYKPSWMAGIAAGRITIAVDRSSATILGPALHVRKLLRAMRTRQHEAAYRT